MQKSVDLSGLLPLFGEMPESSSSDEASSRMRASQRSHLAIVARERLACLSRRRKLGGAHDEASGFTLIELLAVIAIVAVLAALVFGNGGRTGELGRVAKAKADLVAIAAALESFAREQGDYPRGSGYEVLVQSLVGRRGQNARPANGRVYLSATELTWRGDPTSDDTAALLDPWGNAYRYAYKTGTPAEWKAPRYVLYSAGPNGLEQPPDHASSFVDLLTTANADNIYAGE